jgi:hypothetical protein
LESFKIRGKECEEKCRNTPNCTHFTWNGENEGTCFLKHGYVTKKDAIYVNNKSIVCGILISQESTTSSTSQSTTEESSLSTTDYDLDSPETSDDELDEDLDDEIEDSASKFSSQMSSTAIMNTTNKSKKLIIYMLVF